ncbi:MAG: succinate dehydrogenase, hydrophobic rane anchor protein [Pseudomonadota bacterium]|jgi:succinate dehydrogenase / fumarate reductase membrane anchor subunit|nr:succinate dehydrogenase, hydrophobic membrane anchor protein [Burkholderiales bacterium]
MVKRIVTGAKYGFSSWLRQRVTAVIMLIITVLFFAFLLNLALHTNSSIDSWRNLFNDFLVKFVVQLFFSALVLHGWIGVRDLWMDYIKSNLLRLTLHVVTLLWLAVNFIYSIKIIWA